MPFRPVESEKLSVAVVRQIEELILRGILRPGERLPAERELAERLRVSRPSLRDAIGLLQKKGLVTAKPGAGVYIADVLGSAFSPALTQLFARHEEAVYDYLSFRRDMEGMAAERATQFATEADLQVVQTVFDKMEAAQNKRDAAVEARLDADFHMSIIEASHNVVMLHMMRSMYELLREGVFYNRQVMFRQRTTRQLLLNQHREINAALQARDGPSARRAIQDHLDYIENCLRSDAKVAAHEEVAKQRLDHVQNTRPQVSS